MGDGLVTALIVTCGRFYRPLMINWSLVALRRGTQVAKI
jgi:hypothetical protein